MDVGSNALVFDQLTQLGFAQDLDAFHVLPNGNAIFSANNWIFGLPDVGNLLLSTNGNGNLPGVGSFLDGENLMDGVTRQIDAAFVPEPGTALLVALGLGGLALRGRSR